MPRRHALEIAESLEARAAEARNRHEARLAVEAGGVPRDIERARRMLAKVHRATLDDAVFAAMERLSELRREVLAKRLAELDGKAKR